MVSMPDNIWSWQIDRVLTALTTVWPPPLGASEYRNSCAQTGKYARCCVLPPVSAALFIVCRESCVLS